LKNLAGFGYLKTFYSNRHVFIS